MVSKEQWQWKTHHFSDDFPMETNSPAMFADTGGKNPLYPRNTPTLFMVEWWITINPKYKSRKSSNYRWCPLISWILTIKILHFSGLNLYFLRSRNSLAFPCRVPCCSTIQLYLGKTWLPRFENLLQGEVPLIMGGSFPMALMAFISILAWQYI